MFDKLVWGERKGHIGAMSMRFWSKIGQDPSVFQVQ